MTTFLTVAGLLTALALACVVPPLLRNRRGETVDYGRSNLALMREQLAELEADRASGVLAEDKYEQARTDIERRVLDESALSPAPGGAVGPRGRAAALVVALFVPVGATLLYLHVGSPDALDAQAPAVAGAAAPGHADLTREQIEGMVARLESRLKEKPDDGAGWALLARSRLVLQQFPEAVKAYAKAAESVTDDAGLYADYADALGMLQGRRLTGEPERLIAQALKIEPNHVKALALAGTVAFEKKDYRGAVAYWERILKVLPADSQFAASIQSSIAEASSLAGGAPPAAPVAREPAVVAAGAGVSGTISLAPSLAGKAAPTDTVFILARALEGPRMPLAIVRKQVKDLPLDFTLNDAQAMAPQMKLSNFREVTVTARVSKSGGATPQSGDLQGATSAVKVGATGLNIVIDTVIP